MGYLKYKGYTGSVEYSEDDKCHFVSHQVAPRRPASYGLPSSKLRVAVDQVTPPRPSSYVSTALKWDFRCVKPTFSRSQTYAFTQSNLRFDGLKT